MTDSIVVVGRNQISETTRKVCVSGHVRPMNRWNGESARLTGGAPGSKSGNCGRTMWSTKRLIHPPEVGEFIRCHSRRDLSPGGLVPADSKSVSEELKENIPCVSTGNGC